MSELILYGIYAALAFLALVKLDQWVGEQVQDAYISMHGFDEYSHSRTFDILCRWPFGGLYCRFFRWPGDVK